MPGGGKEQKGADYTDPNQRFHITAEIKPTLQGRIYAATDLKTGNYTIVKEVWKECVKNGISRDGTPINDDIFEETRILNKLSAEPTKHLRMFVLFNLFLFCFYFVLFILVLI